MSGSGRIIPGGARIGSISGPSSKTRASPAPGAARERLRPRVEVEPDREDQARVLEPDHVLGPRLVVVRVEPGREDQPHLEPVAGHAAREVVDREHGRGGVAARGALCGCTRGRRPRARPRRAPPRILRQRPSAHLWRSPRRFASRSRDYTAIPRAGRAMRLSGRGLRPALRATRCRRRRRRFARRALVAQNCGTALRRMTS